MDEKYIQDLYNGLGGEGVFGKYEDFSKLISEDDAYRKDVYNGLGGEEVFGKYEDYDALVKKKGDGALVSPTGSEAAPTPSKVDRDAEIRKLTAKAVAGDTLAKEGLERLQREKKSAQPFDEQIVDITAKADETAAYIPRNLPKVVKQDVGEFLETTPAYIRTQKPEIDVIRDNFGTRTAQVDFDKIVKEGKKTGQVAEPLEREFQNLEEDYLDYLEATNPELASANRNKLNALRGKETLMDAEKKWLLAFRNDAIEKRNLAAEAAMWEIKESADVKEWQRRSTEIGSQVAGLDRDIAALGVTPDSPPSVLEKAKGLINQRNALVAEYEALGEKTGFTPDKQEVYFGAAKQLIGAEPFMRGASTGMRFPELKAQQDEEKRIIEARKQTAEIPVIGQISGLYEGFQGVVRNMQSAMFKLPKVIGDALGDEDYDWVDEMYNLSTDFQSEMDVLYSNPFKEGDKVPTGYETARMLGEGVGSVGMFIAGGEVAALAQIPARVGVVGTAFLTGTSDYYEEAIAAGMNPKEAARTAIPMSAVSAMIEGIVPDAKYIAPSEFRRSVIRSLTSGKPFKEAMRDAIDALPDATRSYLDAALKEGVEEGVAQVGTDVAKEVSNAIQSNKFLDLWSEDAYKQSIMAGALTGGVLNVFSRPKSYQASPIQEEILGYSVENRDDIVSEFSSPAFTSVTTNINLDIIREAKEIKDGLNGTPSFQKLSVPVQNHVMAELLRKKKLEEGMKASGIRPESTLAEIAAIETEIKSILDAEIKPEEYDKKDEQGIPSGVREGEAPVSEQPVEGAGAEAIEAGGVLQAQEEIELAPEEEVAFETEITNVRDRVKQEVPDATDEEADLAASYVQEYDVTPQEAVDFVRQTPELQQITIGEGVQRTDITPDEGVRPEPTRGEERRAEEGVPTPVEPARGREEAAPVELTEQEESDYAQQWDTVRGSVMEVDPNLSDAEADYAATMVQASNVSPEEAVRMAKENPDDVAAFMAEEAITELETSEGEKAVPLIEQALSESGIKVEIKDDSDYNEDDRIKNGQGRGSEGMFIADDGTIILNRDKIKGEWGKTIVFHEGIHPVINIIRNTDPKRYKSIIDGLKAEAARNNGVAQAAADVAASEYYQQRGAATIEDETLVETMARVGTGNINIDTFKPSFREKFIEFMNDIAKMLGLKRIAVNSPRMEVKRLADQINNMLNEGGKLSDVVGKENVMSYENNLAQESGMIETGSVVYAGQASAKIKRGSKVKNPYRESVDLPVKTLQSLLDEYGDNVIVVNSDPTGLGTVRLPSGKVIELDGGIGYMAIQENIDAGVGFASSSDARVKFLYKTANQMNADGKLKNGKVLVLVMVQKADSMLGNNYTPDYVADALAKIPQDAISKEKLINLLVEPLKKETFKSFFYTESKIPKMKPYKNNSKKTAEENKKLKEDYIKKYNAEVAKITESNAKKKADGLAKVDAIEAEIRAVDPRTAHDDMVRIFHELSFVQAQKYFDNILGSYTNKTTKYGLEISRLLYEHAGADQKNLFQVLGEKSLVDQLIQDPKAWGYAVAAFVHDTAKQTGKLGGIKHNLFNAKFQGDERFILEEAYKVNDIMTEFNEQQVKKVEEGLKRGAVFAEQQASQGMYPSGKAVIPSTKGVKLKSLQETKGRFQASKGIDRSLPAATSERITKASENLQAKFRRDGIPLSNQEAVEIVQELASWKDWYEGIAQMVQDNFEEYAADYMMFMFGSAVAADSAGTIGTALNNLERLYAQEEIKGLPIMKRNIYEILSGLPVTSDKISNFIAAGLGDKNAIPVDMHVWSFINSFPTTKTPTKKDFDKAKEFVRAVADGLGWDPREVQAAMWAANMLRLGQKPDTYEEYIQKKIDSGLQKQIQGWRDKGYKPVFAVRQAGEKIETVFLQDAVKETFAPKLEEVKQKISKGQASAMDRNQIKSGFEPSKIFSGANEDIANASDQYKEENGLSQQTPSFILNVSENDAKRVADAYEKMKHDPENPQVKQGFSELITEIKKQADVLLSMGYKFQLSKEGEGYGSDSKKMSDDVRKNKRIFVDPSSKSFGTKRTFDKDNIGLQDSGYKDANGVPMTNVELIRAVHDLFGHAEFGNGFGPIGEENAWRNHMSMFTPLAQKALTTTTRGQNSWVNFGPHMRNEDGSIKKSGDKGYLPSSQRPFAEQKIGFLPEWAMDNSYGDKATINGKSVKPVNKYVLEGTEMYEINDGNAFYEAIKAAKESRGADGIQVSLKSAEDYQNIVDNGGRLIVTKDGLAGLMVEADGNVGSGFAHADIPAGKNTLKPLLLMAIKLGARYTDAYDTYLPGYYAKFGFKPLNRIKFNEEFAEKGWEKTTLSSKPDVVVMYWDGGSRENVDKNYGKFAPYSKSQGDYTNDYDAAIESAKEKSLSIEPSASLVPPKIPIQASAMDRGAQRTEPVTIEGSPKGIFLNIGLLEGMTNRVIPVSEMLEKLPQGVTVIEAKEVQGTEPTVSVQLSRKLTDAEMDNLLADTKQMAIPQLANGEGVIHGTTDWGPFNPEYFILPNNKSLLSESSQRAAEDLLGGTQPQFSAMRREARPTVRKTSQGYQVISADGKPLSRPNLTEGQAKSMAEKIGRMAPAAPAVSEAISEIDTVLEQKGKNAAEARRSFKERYGQDAYDRAREVTLNFDKIINDLEQQGRVRKDCP